ncbi:MAG: hypothetical protein U0354_01280 [Candidatus Sericytochromatia bacterium]
MILRNRNDKGIALITSLVMTTVVIGILTVVLYKITSTTKEVLVVQRVNTAKNIADEGLENMVDWLNNRNNPENYKLQALSNPLNEPNELLRTMTSEEFLQPVNVNITSLSGLESTINSLTLATNMPSDFLKSIYHQATNSKTAFPPIIIPNIEGTVLNSYLPTGQKLSQLDDNARIYTYKNIGKDNKNKGQFRIGVNAVTSKIDHDILKIGINSYVPAIGDPKAIVKKYIAVVQRPKDVKIKYTQAILAGGNINLGNGDTQAGTTPTTLVANEGDVHTNQSLTIGPNGTINGDASASGTINNSVTNNTNISGTTTPNAPEKPLPKIDYQNPFPTNECQDLDPDPNKILYNGDCVAHETNISLNGQEELTITGRVYVRGSYSEGGQGKIIGKTPQNPLDPNYNKIPMLITMGNLSTSGNAATESTDNRMLFISVKGNMDITGNAAINGLFINDNPNGVVDVKGNGSIFGGIISQNTVKFSGTNATVTRNTALTNLPQKIDAEDYNMRLISWKEIN